ncbi:MAG: glycerol-3-phosphate 1-O-acyltransferase PlsY [Erysipelotrichaceae bacterium]|nr:glycerol-3-phosphate 1-O-acyltransferase PlsY [Erysipelotrichaceae bacterium]
MKILLIVLTVLIGYLYGSINFALVIGKTFFHKDIRNEGSHNLGGTNAGRVLGKKVGIIVILLDSTKSIISILFARYMSATYGLTDNLQYITAFACIFGHCYPVFADFKGGKGVSSAVAYALMTNVYGFIISIAVFLVTLKTTKYVSLSSMLGALSVLIASPFLGYPAFGIFINFCIAALIIYRHSANIERLRNGTENKISWM